MKLIQTLPLTFLDKLDKNEKFQIEFDQIQFEMYAFDGGKRLLGIFLRRQTMKDPKTDVLEKKLVLSEFDFKYQPDPDVKPEELSGNANLALHHHMAPPDGYDDEEG